MGDMIWALLCCILGGILLLPLIAGIIFIIGIL